MAADLSYFRVVKPIISELTSLQVLKTKPPIAEYLLEGTFLSTSEDIDMIINLIEVKTGQNIKQFRIKKRIGDDSYFNALVAISYRQQSVAKKAIIICWEEVVAQSQQKNLYPQLESRGFTA